MAPSQDRTPSTGITPERWQQVKDLLGEVLELELCERAGFLERTCGRDDSLRSEIEALLAADTGAELLSQPIAVAEGEEIPTQSLATRIGLRVGPYQILEEIGIGGMGEVYRAFRADDEYKVEVAIKLVRIGQDSKFVVERFRHERQVLAGLSHPNIARLLDGGTTEDGIPYFVMELVQGQPFTEYCDAHALSTTERLKLFLQVCSAVQYAHQRLIVHRDLKPGNILVTADGIPKLLDFGIAKVVDPAGASSHGDATLSIFSLLTPAYASPEQVKGEPVTTASDGYSLGVLLYECLTGQRPYGTRATSPHELVRAVCESEPEKPSTVIRRTQSRKTGDQTIEVTPLSVSVVRDAAPDKLARRLRGDLDNIVLMALRKEPERRYTSVEQFSTDITRHLERLPVIASRDTVRYRATKFIGRHSAGVAAAAALLLVILAGSAATLYEAHRARQNELRAEKRFNDVRALANSLLFDIHDSVKDLPGATAARKLIVENALRYLDSLGEESRGDLSLQREIASGYERVGDVEGSPFNPNYGDISVALKSFEKAIKIREAVWSANSQNVDDGLAFARSLRQLSDTALQSGRISTAIDACNRAVAITQQLATLAPGNRDVLVELFLEYESLANVFDGSGLFSKDEVETAIGYRQKELETARRLASLESSVRQERIMAVALATMGDDLIYSGHRNQGLENYLMARQILEGVVAQTGQQARPRFLLAEINARIALAQFSGGDLRSARASVRTAIEVAQGLVRADPADQPSRVVLIDYYSLLLYIDAVSGKLDHTHETMDKAAAILEQIPNGEDIFVTQSEVMLWNAAGNAERKLGNDRKAESYDLKAIAILTQLRSEDGPTATTREYLAASFNNLGALQIGRGELQKAAESFHQALTLIAPEGGTKQPNLNALYAEADAYTGLGDFESKMAGAYKGQERLKHLRRSCASYEQSLSVSAGIREPGIATPWGFLSVPPAIVALRLAQCKQASSMQFPLAKFDD